MTSINYLPRIHLHSGHSAANLSKVTYSNSYTHSYTDGGGCHAKCRPAHYGQFWGSVSCQMTRRHADQGNQTSDLLITRWWLYPPKATVAWVVKLFNTYFCLKTTWKLLIYQGAVYFEDRGGGDQCTISRWHKSVGQYEKYVLICMSTVSNYVLLVEWTDSESYSELCILVQCTDFTTVF